MNWLIAVAKPCFIIVVRKQIDPQILIEAIVLSRPAEKRPWFYKIKSLEEILLTIISFGSDTYIYKTFTIGLCCS